MSPRIKVLGSILFFLQYMPVYLKCLRTIKRSLNRVTYIHSKRLFHSMKIKFYKRIGYIYTIAICWSAVDMISDYQNAVRIYDRVFCLLWLHDTFVFKKTQHFSHSKTVHISTLYNIISLNNNNCVPKRFKSPWRQF